MPAIRQVYPKFKAWNHTLKIPLAGGKVHTYINGSTVTTKGTFSDRQKAVPNANPVILDANGEANIFLETDGLYTFVIRDSADVLVEQIDNVGFLVGSERGALVYTTGAQSIPNNTSTAITWDLTIRDTDDIHNPSSNSSRLTIPNGIVQAQFFGQLSWTANAIGTRSIDIRKNGAALTPPVQSRVLNAGASDDVILQVSSPKLVVAPGDYFELFAVQNSGGALTAGTGGKWFAVEFSR